MPFDFPITVEDLEQVPEEFRSLYVPEEGKDSAMLLPDLKKRFEGGASLHKALEAERKKAAAAEKALKAWKDAAGVEAPESLAERFESLEAEHAAALEEARKEAGTSGKSSDEAVERRVQQVREEKDREWGKKLTAEVEKAKKAEEAKSNMFRSLERYMKENAAMQAISVNKGRPHLLKRIVMDHLKIVEDNDKYELRVVDEDGDDRYDGEGKPMSVENLVATMRQSEEYGPAFEGDGATGSGSRTPAGAGGRKPSTNPWSKATWNATEQAKILKTQPQLAARLEAEAKNEARR
jgi:hypothetical protein